MPTLPSSHSQTISSEGGYWCNFFPLNITVREYLPFNQMQEQVKWTGTAISCTQKKEGKGGRREKGEAFKFRYLLTETQKKHTYRHHVGRNPSSQGCGALLPASICLKRHRSFLPLSHAQKRTEDRSELPTKVYLRFNESVIHYNKSHCNINICRKNRLSAAPQQTLVLIQYNKTLADHRKKVGAIPLK